MIILWWCTTESLSILINNQVWVLEKQLLNQIVVLKFSSVSRQNLWLDVHSINTD